MTTPISPAWVHELRHTAIQRAEKRQQKRIAGLSVGTVALVFALWQALAVSSVLAL